jgi:spermidine synthase
MKTQEHPATKTDLGPLQRHDTRFWTCLVALGTSSVSVQLIMIREIMSTFSGNELVIGLVLGAWLLATALGSALGVPLSHKTKPKGLLCLGHVFIATIPFCQLALIRFLPLLWVRGEMMGLGPAVLWSTAIVLPFCLVGGAMIPVAGALLKDRDAASRVYVADALGDITGGVLFSFVLVYTFSHWDSLVGLALLNLVAAAAMLPRAGVPLAVLLGLGLILARPLDRHTLSWRFPGQTIVVHKNTPFAQLTISKMGRQFNVFEDAIPLFSTNDLTMEAKAHLALSQVKQGADVLLIGGGVFGTVEEMAKHEPARIDYVELDPAILDLDQWIGKSLVHPFVHVHIGDGRLFARETKRRYDVVVIDLPGPENAQLNRFYSLDFFREIKAVLAPRGVLSFSLVGGDNYVEEKGLAVNRSVHAALRKVFDNVLVFPGQTHYYLASDGPLRTDIAPVLAERKIATRQLADYDLPAMSDPLRIELLARLLNEGKAQPNRDLSPAAFGHFMDMWLKKSGSSKGLLYILLVLALGFAGLSCRKDPVNVTIMTSGYAAMALELCLLLLFQVLYGYVYLRICLFVTLFMTGSAVGAFLSKKTGGKTARTLIITDLALVVLSLAGCLAAVTGVGSHGRGGLLAMQFAVIPALIFITAFTVGYQFTAASRIAHGTGTEVLGRLYVADLAGAACGTILTGLVFVPKIGVIGVLISVTVLKVLSVGLSLGVGLHRASGNKNRSIC